MKGQGVLMILGRVINHYDTGKNTNHFFSAVGSSGMFFIFRLLASCYAKINVILVKKCGYKKK